MSTDDDDDASAGGNRGNIELSGFPLPTCPVCDEPSDENEVCRACRASGKVEQDRGVHHEYEPSSGDEWAAASADSSAAESAVSIESDSVTVTPLQTSAIFMTGWLKSRLR